MSLISAIAALVGLIIYAISSSAQLYLWQRKEYRFDRLISALKSPELRTFTIPWLIVAGLSVMLTTIPLSPLLLQVSTFTLLLGLLAWQGAQIYRRGVLRPKPTLKLGITAAFLVIFASLSCYYLRRHASSDLMSYVLLYLVLPLLVTTAIVVTNIITSIRKRQIIQKASLARSKHANLKVVGVTGSVGKTSTKNFAAQIIPNATTSREHRNNELVIAQDILAQINQRSHAYIAEMGAYKRGEIAALCRLAKPTIGVITHIGTQHMSLFGSQEKILEAKWELIDALPPHGIAILNADDPLLRKRAQTYSGKILWYATRRPADVYVDQINIEPLKITCRLHIKDSIRHISLPLASEAMLNSLVAAVAIAEALGVNRNKIAENLSHVQGCAQTMEVGQAKSGATVIDDSYSASEMSVRNALAHLNRFATKDKHVVLVPIIELGDAAHEVHEQIGQLLSRSRAKVFIYGKSYNADIAKGFSSNPNSDAEINYFTDPEKLTAELMHQTSKNSVILLEGRVPAMVRSELGLT